MLKQHLKKGSSWQQTLCSPISWTPLGVSHRVIVTLYFMICFSWIGLRIKIRKCMLSISPNLLATWKHEQISLSLQGPQEQEEDKESGGKSCKLDALVFWPVTVIFLLRVCPGSKHSKDLTNFIAACSSITTGASGCLPSDPDLPWHIWSSMMLHAGPHCGWSRHGQRRTFPVLGGGSFYSTGKGTFWRRTGCPFWRLLSVSLRNPLLPICQEKKWSGWIILE